MRSVLSLSFLLFTSILLGQKPEYAFQNIPDSLKQNANAVIRMHELHIAITSQSTMTIKSTQVITVLNELGLPYLDLTESYDRNRKVVKILASAYDASGKELKTYKRKDFRDSSVADGISVFNDNRILYLDYTPIVYPFTMVFESEVETSNTAFIPSWSPMGGYLISTENALLTINCNPELKLNVKEVNFSSTFPITKNETPTTISYAAKNVRAQKREELSPDFSDIFPVVYFALGNFMLENVAGKASNWSEFGKWMYESLLADTEEIPAETVNKLKQLIGNEKDPVVIAAIVYKYVQEKTRYVSVQVGIGGWKPMLAKEVDKLGYGDCKALTNYTRCLLKSVGVPSYYTVVYGDSNSTKGLRSDMASVQGNHVILTLPTNKDFLWLECTSQIHPFGFQGDFTDDRNVLLIKPEGGEIIKTKTFTDKDNTRITKGAYQITEDGSLVGKIKIISNGLQYNSVFRRERESHENQVKMYKDEFDNINNLTIKKIGYTNNSKAIEFTEDLELEAEGYAQNSGGKLMFALNAYDQNSYVPKRYRAREFPFQIQRGYTNESEIEITIPEGFTIEAKPNSMEQQTEFGEYKIEFSVVQANKILCKRKLVVKKGLYDKTKYENYRKFREIIAKNDNSKIIIAKT